MSNQAYINYLNSLTDSIVTYSVLSMLPIGVIGNLFSIYIYSRPNLNKKTNTGFLYACFCLLNILLLLYFTFVFRSSFIFNYSVRLPCGMVTYLLRAIWCSVPWSLVLISFDRFVMVVFPLKKHIMSKKWVLFLFLLGIFAFVVVISVTNLLQYPTPVSFNGVILFYTCTSPNSQNSMITSILTIIGRIYIPFVIMLTLNIIVLRRLRQSKIKVGVANVTRIGQQRNQPGQISNKEYRFIISTLFIDITFFVFYTPLAVFITISGVQTITPNLFDSVTNAFINLFYSTTQVLALLYSVASFFIFAIFNRYFRNEVVTVLRLKRFLPKVFNESVSILNDTPLNRTANEKPKSDTESNVNII